MWSIGDRQKLHKQVIPHDDEAMSIEWADIQYRDFYDVPRIFVFRANDRVFLADCPFDEEIDDYLKFYTLFELPPDADRSLDGSWQHLRDTAFEGAI